MIALNNISNKKVSKAEKINVNGKFTPEMIQRLRASYKDLPDRLDPASPALKDLETFLDKFDDDTVKQVMNAKIKWVSTIAGIIERNRRWNAKDSAPPKESTPENDKAKYNMMEEIREEVIAEGKPIQLGTLHVYCGEDLFSNQYEFGKYVESEIKNHASIEIILKGRISYIALKEI
jgi:hypothetical protein